MFEKIKTQNEFIEVALPAYVASRIVKVAKYVHENEGCDVIAKEYVIGETVSHRHSEKFKHIESLQKEWYQKFYEKYPGQQRHFEKLCQLKNEDAPYSIYGYFKINISESDVWKIVDKILSKQHDEETERYLVKKKVDESIDVQRYREKYGKY